MIQLKWINDYWQLEQEISEIQWDLKKSNLELKRWVDTGDLFNSNSFQTSLENQLRLKMSIRSLEIVLEEKQRLKEELLSLIDQFKGLENKILKLKYIDGLTLEQVAEELSYSESHIRKKHAELSRTIKLVESLRG